MVVPFCANLKLFGSLCAISRSSRFALVFRFAQINAELLVPPKKSEEKSFEAEKLIPIVKPIEIIIFAVVSSD